MRTNRAVILTQEHDDNSVLTEMLADHNIDTLNYPCISTKYPVIDSSVKFDNFSLGDFPLYIFTSRRGVHGIQRLKEHFCNSNAVVACVGESTANAVEELLGIKCGIVPESDSTGKGLAEEIIRRIAEPSYALHIRGNKTTGDLKRALEEHGWRIYELVSYENCAPEIAPLDASMYNAAVFASPSAVDRFFTANPESKSGLTCIAIGTTTASRLLEIGAVKVIVSPNPDKTSIVNTVLNILNME